MYQHDAAAPKPGEALDDEDRDRNAESVEELLRTSDEMPTGQSARR
jgi:hypothetical protein